MSGTIPEVGRTARRWPRPGRAAAALLFLLVAVIGCFPKALSSEWVFFSRDTGSFWYPNVSTFVRVVGEPGLPLWDPYEAYGLPLWADPASQVAYPPTWLHLLLLPQTVCKLLVIGHLFLGGAGTFALLRRWRLGVLPAVAAAVTFACAGPVVSAGSLISPHLCGIGWLPWALWAFEGALERGSRRDVALLALVLGAQAVTGSAEACTMSGLAALLRWALLASRSWSATIERTLPALAGLAIAALLASVQWLPTLAVTGRTTRMLYPAEAKLSWSVHPATLVDLLVPQLVSDLSMGPEPRRVLFGGREPFLASLYLGAATLPFVFLSLRSDRSQRLWAWLAFGCFLCLSLGSHFAPARAVLALPPLSVFRYPSKYMWGAALAWAVLAGLGTEMWWRAWSRRDRAIGGAQGALLLALALALGALGHRLPASQDALVAAFQIAEPWRASMAVLASWKVQAAAGWLGLTALLLLLRAWRTEWSRATALSALALVALDMTAAARPVNPLAPAALLTHRPPLLEQMSRTVDTRLLSTGGDDQRLNQDLAYGPRNWEPAWSFALGTQERIVSPLGSRWNLRGSYDGDVSGINSPQQAFMSMLVLQTRGTPLGLRLLQMGNVGWVIDVGPDDSPLLPEAVRAQSVFGEPLRLRRVPDPLAPCYVVGTAARTVTSEDAIRRIASPDFDPRREVVLDGVGPTLAGPPDFRGSAVYRLRHANRLRIETDASAAGMLVASEAFDPDWRATVDGIPARLERANVLFRGVHVPAGRHLVEMTYFPRAIGWGIGAAALGLVLVGLLLRPVPRR